MLYFSHDILYHVLLMLIPIIVYQIFLKQENPRRNLPTFLFTVLIMLILTMSSPIEFAPGYLYDLRVIPIIIAFLYGGIFPGILTVLVMLAYRFLLGGDGFYVILINYTIATILLYIISRKYNSYNMRARVIVISLFYWTVACTRAVTLIGIGQMDQLIFMITFSLLTWVTLVMVIFMIENINKQFAMKEELEKTERLNAISQLAASIAHEVRNPMTSIKGFMQLMKEDTNLNDSQKYYIDITLDEINRTEAIINEYLSLAKPVSSQYELIHLSHEIRSTIDLMTSLTNAHNIAILSSIDDTLYVKGKKGEMKQVLLNIIKNGVEAIGSKGTLTIQAYNQNQFHVIEIMDDGVGMTKQQLKRLGTPFYSTKDKGTGVGLSVSYNIVKSMKGRIEVKTVENKGTTFTIFLPAYIDI
jgi:two-component system sporulation sensor kinase B